MKAYTIVFEWSTDDCDGVDVEVFSTYKKALARYNEIIFNEKKPEISWVADAFDGNGNFIDNDDYVIKCSDFDDSKEHELWWRISKCSNWDFHDHLKLRILEIK